MRKAIGILIWVLAVLPVNAITRYVDGGCSSSASGNATITTCGATNGPKKTIDEGVSLLVGGDVLEIRGGHGTFNGTYRQDRVQIRNHSDFTIQGYKYAQVGAERPVIEATSAVTWIPCLGHEADSQCVGIIGPASEFYYYVGGTVPNVGNIAALDSDGRITYRVNSKADMTNAHSNFIAGSCSAAPFIPCLVDSACPTPQTCTGATAIEKDSYNGGTYLLVRWANCVPGTVYYTNNGYGLDIATGSNITVRGITFRTYRAGITHTTDSGGTAPSNLTVTDNWFLFAAHQGSGYQLAFYGATPLTLTNNFHAYSRDEAIHTDCNPSAPMVMTIQDNFIRDGGEYRVLGPEIAYCSTSGACPGTPTDTPCYSSANCPGTACCKSTSEAMTLSSSSSASHTGAGDYSGSVISGNVIRHVAGNGIIFENNHHGTVGAHVTVRDNVIDSAVRAGFKIACDGQTASSTVGYIDFYSNIVSGANSGAGDGGIRFSQGSGACTVDHVATFNNTVSGTGVSLVQDGGTQFTNNTTGNNVLYSTTAGAVLTWPAPASGAGNTFKNNLLYANGTAPGSTIASINGTSFTVTQWSASPDVDGDAVTDANKYGDPLFVNLGSLDFRLKPNLNPAIDAGTMTGMPARTGINNRIASAHGLPDYSRLQTVNIASSPDIGAYEVLLNDGGFESGAFGAWTKGSWRGCSVDTTAILTNAGDVGSGTPGHAIAGTYSLRMGHQGTIIAPGGACEGAHQVLQNLDVSRYYTLTGTYYTPTAIDATGTSFDVNFAGADKKCQFIVGYLQNVDFSCSFVPIADSIDLTIETCCNTQNDYVYIDSLALR